MGDWRCQFGFAVGNFALRFNNWPILDDAFVEEIARRLSGRWTLILGHYWQGPAHLDDLYSETQVRRTCL